MGLHEQENFLKDHVLLYFETAEAASGGLGIQPAGTSPEDEEEGRGESEDGDEDDEHGHDKHEHGHDEHEHGHDEHEHGHDDDHDQQGHNE
jgi:hypothetical protein